MVRIGSMVRGVFDQRAKFEGVLHRRWGSGRQSGCQMHTCYISGGDNQMLTQHCEALLIGVAADDVLSVGREVDSEALHTSLPNIVPKSRSDGPTHDTRMPHQQQRCVLPL